MAKDETVTLSRKELGELVSMAVSSALTAMQANAAGAQQFDPNKWREQAKALPITVKRFRSVVNDAEFDAVIDHRGLISRLENYKEPAGLDKHVDEGGRVPVRLPIANPDGKPSPEFQDWRADNFWIHDLRMFVGTKPDSRLVPIDVAA